MSDNICGSSTTANPWLEETPAPKTTEQINNSVADCALAQLFDDKVETARGTPPATGDDPQTPAGRDAPAGEGASVDLSGYVRLADIKTSLAPVFADVLGNNLCSCPTVPQSLTPQGAYANRIQQVDNERRNTATRAGTH